MEGEIASRGSRKHEEFSKYFDVILGLDADKAIHSAISKRFSGSVRRFLEKRYVFRMAFLAPRFVSLMMSKSNHGIDWGPPRFPVVD